ncbi:MAG TPA: pilus assembly protein TadG-related protein, partial [Polyangiaceae bacterium LLY-WYZ-15_(1-7)]|nr:pilus assembly protein TadG-related protein [Polyangiaceae bacterium LLY-WYZ-15_(1-7)]
MPVDAAPVEATAAETSPGRRSLLRDDEGAMMLLGVFMTTLVVAMLYYIAGVGETIVYRERMQDAADAGAMAGA